MGIRSRVKNLPSVNTNLRVALHSRSQQSLLARDPSSLRVIQRNLVYITNIPEALAQEAVLTQYEYFGQYGTIEKCIVGQSKSLQFRRPSFNAYITYASEEEAALCIKACNFFRVQEHVLEVTLGTTRYCTHFLKGQACPKDFW